MTRKELTHATRAFIRTQTTGEQFQRLAKRVIVWARRSRRSLQLQPSLPPRTSTIITQQSSNDA
jgi:hypothetical protein